MEQLKHTQYTTVKYSCTMFVIFNLFRRFVDGLGVVGLVVQDEDLVDPFGFYKPMAGQACIRHGSLGRPFHD
jgi:hypothetical protein